MTAAARHRRWWSSSELRTMQAMRKARSTRKEIAARLGRTEHSVKQQIGRFAATMKLPDPRCPTCGKRR